MTVLRSRTFVVMVTASLPDPRMAATIADWA